MIVENETVIIANKEPAIVDKMVFDKSYDVKKNAGKTFTNV
ncbi:hypothetical protein HSACCH_00276 [Halanaerobium saccharolyticum subsp. saccharolyticum DSM 6643]|uniref:Uncharacterized protein n=1 Tax=Halanaerobium saccharolyticum subsp. saccharolyticum DSM 6643 TaxID=1293054 RepID=M5EB08_9FIRM|nr:hypothetical protein HSACCH_00276 [Halanaerobium saccharolyticum subsp. saccharolyticum DSM 6643]